jgi:hypothetical protein
VVVVSAPTPFAPLVAFRPVKRWSGLVDALFGVVLGATPAVVPASVGVPVALVVFVVPAVLAVAPLTPAEADGPVAFTWGVAHGMVRRPALSPVVCWAFALTAMVEPSSIAMAAMRHRTMYSVSSFTFVMRTS